MESYQKEWLTPSNLEEYYDISTSRQARLRIEQKIPYHKIGRYIRYKKADIDIWLDEAKVV